MSTAVIRAWDGVGTAIHGNVLLAYYAADARLDRTQWLFDRADEFAAEHPGGILCLMVIAGNAAPPDGPIRVENDKRLKTLESTMQMLVTVTFGDSITRAAMRTMVQPRGKRTRQVVVSTESEGIRRLLELASPETPSRAQIEADLLALRAKVPLNTT
jgi:hypothetical protein